MRRIGDATGVLSYEPSARNRAVDRYDAEVGLGLALAESASVAVIGYEPCIHGPAARFERRDRALDHRIELH